MVSYTYIRHDYLIKPFVSLSTELGAEWKAEVS